MATSNKLGMYLPTREDYISVKRDISDNLAILDAAAGDMDIIINGNTASENVTSGQFVTVLNSTITGVTDGIYKAVANVAAGVPFVAANLTAPTNGALNELVDKIATKSTTLSSAAPSVYRQSIRKSGNVVYVFVGINQGMTANTDFSVGTLPEGCRPNVIIQAPGIVSNGSNNVPIGNVFVIINTDGTIIINSTAVGYVAFAISFVVSN